MASWKAEKQRLRAARTRWAPSHKLIERPVTVTCGSNEVGGPYISTANFTGVLLADMRGWGQRAPIETMSRIDSPGAFGRVDRGDRRRAPAAAARRGDYLY